MVKLNKIYTKTGDKGCTLLTSGDVVDKFNIRIEAYGTVDELNACLGAACMVAQDNAEIAGLLQSLQHDLFDLGADLSTPMAKNELTDQALRIISSQTIALEQHIDRFNEPLAALKSFVLPNGTKLAVQLHICRTVARRAERLVARLTHDEGAQTNPECLKYLNRLSDLFFVLSRFDNEVSGQGDILWQPAKNR
ncbi:MAG: cob(I)yrinic acid a,c-diamide adenosyltransferase [Rhizobiales bacterium]|nr:cob(I)yrinic acid a,c-diamide adenosyltransferase [Hyphomicrobiales bacterium]NRB15705.1 cob(I)yrinic acid a,c-diamide adenosyltransferase [Hyphomicrobiales bacterium]